MPNAHTFYTYGIWLPWSVQQIQRDTICDGYEDCGLLLSGDLDMGDSWCIWAFVEAFYISAGLVLVSLDFDFIMKYV